MKNLTEHLASYASYHRDRRNIATHFIGIPMILFAVVVLLSRPQWMIDSALPLSPALFAAVFSGLYYLKLDIRLGLFMCIILGAFLQFAAPLAAASTFT